MTSRLHLVFIALGLLLVGKVVCGCADNRTPAAPLDGSDVVFDCLPNLDGQLDADELPLSFDVVVDQLVAGDGTTVDLAGAVDERGVRVWDFSADRPGDDRVTVAPQPLAGRWHASSFPGGQFVLGAGDGLEAVYRRDDEALWLLGAASIEEAPPGGRTLLPYLRPVALLRFPLAPGDAWDEVGEVTGGVLSGLPYSGEDRYTIAVDGSGEVKVPYVRFSQAYRVRTDVEVAPAVGGVTVTQRQVSFLFECFGEVVRVVSRTGEPARDFTVAAEVRRFAL
jgi:hypothetical protein